MPVCREQSPPWREPGRACGALSLAGRSAAADGVAARSLFRFGTGAYGDQRPLLPLSWKSRDLQGAFPDPRGFLQRTVGHVRAVDGVSLAISPGRTLALVGESGCGKTTVGKALLQLIAPSAGSVGWAARELVGAEGQGACGRCVGTCRWSSRIPSPRSIRACGSAKSSPKA
jgi:peptide/nickel transport system ATP-binding protein